MLTNAKYTFFGACVFLLMVALVGWSQMNTKPPRTLEEVERLINSELPEGASKAQVEAFLDAQQIRYSNMVELQHPGGTGTISLEKDKKLDGKRHRIKKYFVANIPNVKRWSFFKWDIYITFYFDEEDNFVEYIAREIGDGY